jgi:hypothetical protein
MHTIHVLSSQPAHTALLRAIVGVTKWTLHFSGQWAQTRQQIAIEKPALVVLDLQAIAAARVPAAVAVSEVRGIAGAAKVVLMASRAAYIDDVDRAWAQSCGADALIADLCALRWDSTGGVVHAMLNTDEALLDGEQKRITPYITAAKRAERHQEAAQLIASTEAAGIDLRALAVRMGHSGGVEIKNRSYRLHGYPECFIASEGAEWIAKALKVPKDISVAVGRAMQAAGLIYHVAREQTFADEYLFFRVARLPAQFVLSDFISQITGVRGWAREDRTHMGTVYPQCFIGSEAVEKMIESGFTENEAMSVGQRCVNLSLISHVLEEHPFQNGKFFYRFNDER